MTNAKKKPEAETPEPETPKVSLEVVEKAEPITMNRMALEDEINTRFRMTVKHGITREQCMDEAFWAHVTTRLIPGDTLIVRPDDSAWELGLNVVNNGVGFVQVHEKWFCELVPAEPRAPMPSLYKIDFDGPIHKWRFFREGKMMKDGFATEALAQRAAQQHQMAVSRATPK